MTKLPLALAISGLLIVSGCSEKTSEEYIALAQAKLQQDDVPAAIIDLKNAIGVNGRDAKSRFMLGEIYAQRGSSAAAEKELKRALELGYEPNEVMPLLANVYNLQFKHEEVIELVDNARNLAPDVSTSLLLYKALAHFQLGEPYKAKKAVADANEISADSLYSRLGSAYVDFSNNQVATSLEKINQILQEHPNFADAHLLKGQLTTANNDKTAAVESFEKYKELLPKTFQARVLLANAYFRNREFDKAEKEVDTLLRVNKDQPFVNQLKGAILFQKQEFEKARLHIEKAIQNGLDSTPNKIIAGVTAFKLGLHSLSYDYLISIKNKLPLGHPIFRMIAILELKLGKGGEAGITLSSLDDLSEEDVILLSAASAQLMREGKTDQVKTMLEKVDSMEFFDPLRIAQKGMLRLSMDDIEGLTDLEQALALDPDQTAIKASLASAYIENELYGKALELGKGWIKENPNEAFGYVLAAISYANLGEEALAKQMNDKALQIDPDSIAANTYYADKAKNAGNDEQAIEYLSKVLTKHPDHIATLRKHYVLQKEMGNIKEGLRPIESAFNRATDNLSLRLLFAQALLSSEKYSETIGVLESVTPSSELPEKFWVVLGNAYYNNNQRQKSLNITQAWVKHQPNKKSAYLRLIALHDLFEKYDDALEITQSAKAKFDQDPQFTLLSAYFNIVNGNVESAQRHYASLSSKIQNSVAGQGLLGQILLEQGKAEIALPKLKAFYQQRTNQQNATLVAKALKQLKLYSQAITFLQDHEKLAGKSVINDVQIAELAIHAGNYDMAVEYYLSVLETEPNNSRVLNNLAYILVEQGEFEKALQYAERATLLASDYPPVLDTYATTLMKAGQADLAVQNYAKAFKLDKANLDIAVRYVEALIATKQQKKAGRILAEIKSQDPDILQKIQQLKAQI